MNLEDEVFFLEELSPDQIEVEVETSESHLSDPLTDHDYIPPEPQQPTKSIIPRNLKIRELKALYHCKICGYATLKKDAMTTHALTHKEKEKPAPVQPKQQCIPCPCCNSKKYDDYEKCTECSYFTKKKTSLKIHMRMHMMEKPYKCTECKERAENLKGLIKHYEEVHKGINKFRKVKA